MDSSEASAPLVAAPAPVPVPAASAAGAAKKTSKKKRKAAARAAAAAADGETIDDIFGELKRPKPTAPPPAPAPAPAPPRDRATDAAEDDAWRAGARRPADAGDPSVHRFTDEGLPVYKFYHLGMDQEDGGTPLCPFDCKCCF